MKTSKDSSMTKTQHQVQDATKDQFIEFPFRIKSTLEKFIVAGDLQVRRMDDEDKDRLLRIKNAEYTKEGKLNKFIPLDDCLFMRSIGLDLDEFDEFCSSNYMLIAPSIERAKEFNLALKLLGNSSSALYIGFNQNISAKHFLGAPCYFGHSALYIGEHEAAQLVNLVRLIEDSRADKKLQTMREIYLHTLIRTRRKESRFIELAIILEMLLLPDSSAELSYRFSLRLAKFMSKYKGKPVQEVFQLARQIYTTRSRLVHTGTDNGLDDIAPTAFEYVRILLAAYLRNRESFQEKRLDQLCLG